MHAVFAVFVGATLAVAGLLFMWFRVPVATFFREARERMGRDGRSQTPLLVFVVGVIFFVGGAYTALGTVLGWVHLK